MENEKARARAKAAKIGAWAYSSQHQRPTNMSELTKQRPEEKMPNPNKTQDTLEQSGTQTAWIPRNTKERLW